jgi:hypothetical protein
MVMSTRFLFSARVKVIHPKKRTLLKKQPKIGTHGENAVIE